MKSLVIATAIAAASILPTVASATQVYHHSGYWVNFAGPNEDNEYTCGMSNSTSNMGVDIKYFAQQDTVTVQIYKDSWRIPNGTAIAVDLGFDNGLWGSIEHGIGYTRDGSSGKFGVVEFDIKPEGFEDFLDKFGHADKMWLRFPSGNETQWTAKMDGSRKAADLFAACVVTEIRGKEQASQPFGTSPASQPFGKRSSPSQPQPAPGSQQQPHDNSI